MEPTYLTLDQIRALGSPARLDIVDALRTLGPSTVADLAEYLGKSPKGLYYHLRTLEEVGLVTTEVRRGESGREEAVYRMAEDELSINPVQDPEYREEVKRGVKMSLSRLERDHDRWVETMQRSSEAHHLGTLMRSRVRATPEVVQEAKQRLDAVMQYLRDNEDREAPQISAVFAIFPTENLD